MSTHLNVQEAAKYLRISKQTLDRYRCHGRGPRYAKLGNCVRYRMDDLDAWVNASTIEPAQNSGARAVRALHP